VTNQKPKIFLSCAHENIGMVKVKYLAKLPITEARRGMVSWVPGKFAKYNEMKALTDATKDDEGWKLKAINLESDDIKEYFFTDETDCFCTRFYNYVIFAPFLPYGSGPFYNEVETIDFREIKSDQKFLELISPAEFELWDILSNPLNGDQGVSLILKDCELIKLLI